MKNLFIIKPGALVRLDVDVVVVNVRIGDVHLEVVGLQPYRPPHHPAPRPRRRGELHLRQHWHRGNAIERHCVDKKF